VFFTQVGGDAKLNLNKIQEMGWPDSMPVSELKNAMA
jgi:hypothetical protein